MRQFRLEATPAVELDIEAAFNWYEGEEEGLGFQFLDQLRAAYLRILDHPLGYQDVRSGIEADNIVILAVLHTARDPAEWQRRI